MNTSPTQAFERYVIDFERLDLAACEGWPDLIKIVRARVKPERDSNKRDRYRQTWWQFAEPQTALREAISRLSRCLVVCIHAKHLILSFQPTDRIFSHALNVFPLDTFTAFATLQSRVHEPWARLLSSSLEDRLRYSASDCFDTFPFPEPDPRTLIPALEAIGARLHEARAKYMVERDQGLTKTYNALKDPSSADPRILELRRLHEQMDRAVLHAYGWADIAVPPYCPLSDDDRAAIKAFEDEVIDRLYVLNAERAKEEELLGQATGDNVKKSKGRKKTPKGQREMF